MKPTSARTSTAPVFCRTANALPLMLFLTCLVASGCVGGGVRCGTEKADAGLMTAIRNDDIDGLRQLLGCGADPNTVVEDWPILWHAIQSGNPIIVRELVKAGADIRYRHAQPDGETMLGAAAAAGLPKVVEILLGAGADPNQRTGFRDFLTPLGRAAFQGNQATCERLIRAGADPNGWSLFPIDEYAGDNLRPRPGVGRTPLMIAASGGHVGAVWRLIELGADASLQNSKGESALGLAEQYQTPVDEIRKLLSRPTMHKAGARTK